MISFLWNIIVGGCFHKWGKWGDNTASYGYIRQQRCCAKCGLMQERFE